MLFFLRTIKKPEIPKKTKKSKKNNASDSEDEKPKKKRVSGYILFSNASRDEVRDSLTTDDEKPKNTDIMKQLAKLWKELLMMKKFGITRLRKTRIKFILKTKNLKIKKLKKNIFLYYYNIYNIINTFILLIYFCFLRNI